MPKVPETYLNGRRNEILDAAMTCFLRKGVHQTTIQDICQEAGLSPGAIYRYFKSKDELIAAVNDRTTEHYRDLVASLRAEATAPVHVLELIGRYFFGRFGTADFEPQARLEVEQWPETLRSQPLRDAARRRMRTLRQIIADLVREQAKATPALRDLDPEAFATLAVAAYYGLELQALVEQRPVDAERLLALFGRLLNVPTQSNKTRAATAARRHRTDRRKER